MNSRPLPPLNALRAFAAAGQHLSFTRAADELHVTPAAVSQQVRNLEGLLGVALFHRGKNSLELTRAGAAALPALAKGFDNLREAIELVHAAHSEAQETQLLNVTAAPSFAEKWLLPRLHRFEQQNPQVRMRLETSHWIADLTQHNIDVAIRFGPRGGISHDTEPLLPVSLAPVCSPATAQASIRQPTDLLQLNLIQVDWQSFASNAALNWQKWFALAGVAAAPVSGISFSSQALCVEYALQTGGVALLTRALVAEEVAQGRLVWPFALTLEADFAYHVALSRKGDKGAMTAFHHWLLAEAAAAPT